MAKTLKKPKIEKNQVEVFERQVAELAPEATFRAFKESVNNGGATIVRGNSIVRVTPDETQIVQSISSPYSSRRFAAGTRLKIR